MQPRVTYQSRVISESEALCICVKAIDPQVDLVFPVVAAAMSESSLYLALADIGRLVWFSRAAVFIQSAVLAGLSAPFCLP
jgi:hypothetical protein